MHHPNSTEAVGTGIGLCLGFIKSTMIFASITPEVALDTAILSAIGAAVGYAITFGLKKLFPEKK